MSITKRSDGKWLVNLKPGGRSGHQVKRVFTTQGEAKAFVNWVHAQQHQDPDWSPVARDNRKLSELLGLWFTSHGQVLASGRDSFARMNSVADHMGDPTTFQLRERFDLYRQTSISAGKSLSTINREHSYLRGALNELKRLGHWSGVNPLTEIRQFKVQQQELAYLSHIEVSELLRSCEMSANPHVTLVAKVALSTGGRWSETENLTLHQLQGNRIQFARTKSGKTRAIPISLQLRSELDEHRVLHPIGTTRLFDGCYGAFMSALDRTSIELPKGQASHVLRHTFASHFMIGGGNILTLQRALGHSSLEMTMRYAHLAPDHMQQVLELNPLATANQLL